MEKVCFVMLWGLKFTFCASLFIKDNFYQERKIQMENLKYFTENAIKWAQNPENQRNYTFWCLAFVEDAYERSNSIEMFGGDDATESANIYGVKTKGTPPRGSLVFYSATGTINGIKKDWGHVGLSLGDGKVIHAWDKIRIDNYYDIENLTGAPGWEKPIYRGWTPSEIFLKGFHHKKYHTPPEYPETSI